MVARLALVRISEHLEQDLHARPAEFEAWASGHPEKQKLRMATNGFKEHPELRIRARGSRTRPGQGPRS